MIGAEKDWRAPLEFLPRPHPYRAASEGERMNLITGATGMMGSAVLDEARKAKLPIKAMYRNTEDAAKAPAGVGGVIADYADMDSLRKAFANIDVLYLVCSPIPQLVELESNAIDACVEKRVRHVVLNSALGAEDYPKSFPSWHRKVEDKLKASGLKYTILRPNTFTQNLLVSAAPGVRAEGTFYMAMGSAKISFIDVRDIAAAVVTVLSDLKAHEGKTYELNGPEALSYGEVATKISQVIGRPVKYVDVPEEAQRKAMLDQHMPEWLVTTLLDLQRYYTEKKKGGEVDNVLAGLLSRSPIRLSQFLEENKDAFRGQAVGV
jgi:uncharacterized protein YbjT (DUF2867 family)